jgi:acyl carrier protein
VEADTAHSLLEIIEAETFQKVTLETSIDELNLDSLDFVDLMMVICAKIKPIPELEWAKFDTVGDIAKALA